MRIGLRLGAACFAGLASVVVAPTAAFAALSECTGTNMCIWGNNNNQWLIGQRTAGSTAIYNLTGDANDQMDSWANRSTTYTGCMFGSANGGGDRQTMLRYTYDDNVGFFNSDEVSSWRTANGC